MASLINNASRRRVPYQLRPTHDQLTRLPDPFPLQRLCQEPLALLPHGFLRLLVLCNCFLLRLTCFSHISHTVSASPFDFREHADVRNLLMSILETLTLFLKMHPKTQRAQGISKLTIFLNLLSLRLSMRILFYRLDAAKSLS